MHSNDAVKNLMDKDINEYLLFHGTKIETVQKIQRHGFDDRVASSTGLFGSGIYFADDPQKANKYAPSDKNGFRYMIVTKVLMGDIDIINGVCKDLVKPRCKTCQGLRCKEVKCLKENNSYDSVLGMPNSSSAKEFITYDKVQSYPEFVIQYQIIE